MGSREFRIVSFSYSRWLSSSFFIALGVSPKGTGGGKFSEFMTDHLFGDENRNVLSSVVNGDGMTNHGRDDGGSPWPGFDDLFISFFIEFFNFAEETIRNKGAFF